MALERRFRRGSLRVRSRAGGEWTLGQGEPQAAIRVRDAGVLRRILLNPALRLGETYMDGEWEPDGCSLLDVLCTGLSMMNSIVLRPWQRRLMLAAARLGEFNDRLSSRRNVAHHYDLDAGLYAAFLDRDLQQYSCAYFPAPGMTLEAAQRAKCELIARKLDLKPGARVLDIGCGWGGLACYLARHHAARVTGITLSQEQLVAARRRAADWGLEDRVEFHLQDYRDTQGSFDAVVSVGMFEHVGRPQYARFFERVQQRLKPDGVALLHTIGRMGVPGRTNAWIRKYIFPGGYIPAASEVLPAIEGAGLLMADLEIWRLHYALTLAEWHRRFQTVRERFRQQLGERFCRMWEFYLQASEAGFRNGDLAVFHFQLLRDLRRLPLSRDYLYSGANSAFPMRQSRVS